MTSPDVLDPFAHVAAHAAVVAGEDEHRILGQLQFIERLHHAADTFVDRVDHRGIRRVVVAADAGLGFELRDQFLLGLVRRMDAEMRQVEKERFVFVPRDEIDGLVGEEVGEVLALRIIRLGVGARN